VSRFDPVPEAVKVAEAESKLAVKLAAMAERLAELDARRPERIAAELVELGWDVRAPADRLAAIVREIS
jgi:hypothetical protein